MVCALVKPSYVDNLSGLHIFLDHLKTVSMTERFIKTSAFEKPPCLVFLIGGSCL